jgi:dihydroxyacetone kinase
LTLLLLPRSEDKPRYRAERVLELLDAPASAPGWKPLQPVVKAADAYVKDVARVEAIRNTGKKVSCE